MSAPSVLIVAAHPDDEVLGCAATAARRAKRGEAVHVAILGTGLAARNDGGAVDARALAALREDARAVGGMLGAKSVSSASCSAKRNRRTSRTLTASCSRAMSSRSESVSRRPGCSA